MLLKNKSGKSINIKNAKEIAAGGEGRIIEHPNNSQKVIKVYFTPNKNSFAKHLSILGSLSSFFVKPQEVYYNSKDEVVGFDMDYVNFNDYFLFNKLFNGGFCNANRIDFHFKCSVLKKVKQAVEELHKSDIVVGDLNQYNIFFSRTGDILFVDVDSFATSCKKHSGVQIDEIRDWTTFDINKSTDGWAYDILSFWTLTFCHPFKWVVPGNTETLEQRVKAGKSYLSKISGINIPPLYQPPTGDLLKQFSEVFSGRRYMINVDGVHIPVSAVIKQPVVSAALNIRELYTGVTALNVAFNFIAVRTSVWELVDTKYQGVTRSVKRVDCDLLYPSESHYAYVIKDVLYSETGIKREFKKPYFFYNNGFLTVFEYGSDVQWNMDLNYQITGRIDTTQVPVYTKSIIVRDTPIQNFGSKKYLNVPVNNRYRMFEVPGGIKNAYFYNDWVAIEYKDRAQVKYIITNATSAKNILKEPHIEFDYLPFFTTKGNTLFVPENGHIAVYKDFSLFMNLDASVCTRDSRLYSTQAGLLLLESGVLYLLNTK